MSDQSQDQQNQTNPPPPSEKGPIPYERFQEVNTQMRALQTELEAIRTQQKKAAEEQLAEQSKWKELAEQRAAELEAERSNRLRLQIATETGLPAALAGRLLGNDEAAMRADAEKLLAVVKGNNAPTPPPPHKRDGGGSGGITEAQMNDPKWVRANQAKIREAVARGEL